MQTLLRGENDSKQSDKIQAKSYRAHFEIIKNIVTILNRLHGVTFERAAKNLSKVAVKKTISIGFSSYPKNVHPSIVRTEFMAQTEQKGTDL